MAQWVNDQWKSAVDAISTLSITLPWAPEEELQSDKTVEETTSKVTTSETGDDTSLAELARRAAQLVEASVASPTTDENGAWRKDHPPFSFTRDPLQLADNVYHISDANGIVLLVLGGAVHGD